VKSEGLAGVTVKITGYWNVAPCSLADREQHLRNTPSPSSGYKSGSSGTLVHTGQAIRQQLLQDSFINLRKIYFLAQ